MSIENGGNASASKLAQRAREQGKHAAQNAARAAEAGAKEGLEQIDDVAEKVAKTPVDVGDAIGAGSLIYGAIWLVLKVRNRRGANVQTRGRKVG